MGGLTWAAVAACLTMVVSLCSIASFYFGRRKAAADDAERQGSFRTDLQYIKDTVRENAKSVDTLSIKLDTQSQQREKEYRQMLVQSAELSVKYEFLYSEITNMKKEMALYHHNN